MAVNKHILLLICILPKNTTWQNIKYKSVFQRIRQIFFFLFLLSRLVQLLFVLWITEKCQTLKLTNGYALLVWTLPLICTK